MLGLIALGLTCFMIFILVKNAMFGKQFSKDDTFLGSVELIIPITPQSFFPIEEWKRNAESIQRTGNHIKVHFLIDGFHPCASELNQLKNSNSFVHVHHFASHPEGAEGVEWMIEQVKTSITSQVVVIGDAEIVPNGQAFISLGKYVTDSSNSFFVVPQTSKSSFLGEILNILNPNLAFVSTFNFKKLAKNLSHPLLGITSGWLGMKLEDFKNLDFKIARSIPWKEAIVQQWDESGKTYALAFGEKQLIRFYPLKAKEQLILVKNFWNQLWLGRSRKAFYLYISALFLWSFPMIFFPTHFFWAIASIFLLVLYRFFTKIVFQESWKAVILHPLSCLFLLSGVVWWLYEMIKKPKES